MYKPIRAIQARKDKALYPSLQFDQRTSQRTSFFKFMICFISKLLSITDCASITSLQLPRIYSTYESKPAIYGEVLVSVLIDLKAVIWYQSHITIRFCSQCFSTYVSSKKRRWLHVIRRFYGATTVNFTFECQCLLWKQCTGEDERWHWMIITFSTKCYCILDFITFRTKCYYAKMFLLHQG